MRKKYKRALKKVGRTVYSDVRKYAIGLTKKNIAETRRAGRGGRNPFASDLSGTGIGHLRGL